MEIIPAIDIMDGKCVRLTQGNYSHCNIYSESPVEVALAFEAAGIRRLHLVDLDGAKASGVVNLRVLQKVCQATRLTVDFGGGIKSEEDLRKVFEAGASLACIGSLAQTQVETTREWLEHYGGEKIIIGADVWNHKVCIQGWKKVTDTTIFQLVDCYRDQLRYLMCTDITRDGMLGGPALPLYQDLLARYPEIQLIASGGVGSEQDLKRLAAAGIPSVIVGKAIYEKKIDIEKIGHFNLKTLC